MNERELLFNLECKATGIGSVPHAETNDICDFIFNNASDLPYWPQMEKVDFRESMMVQYSENFPCLKIDFEKKDVYYDDTVNRDEKILEFFENLTSNNYDYFKIGPDFARGFYAMLEKSKNGENRFMKGQVVGPVTFLLSVIGGDGKAIIHDDMLSDAIIRGLAMKAVWQAKEIRKIGKIPVIFFDEPSMSGFGSAFMSLTRDQFFDIFDKLIATVKEHDDVMVGLHCCGNSDWEVLLQSKIDILSFDAFDYSTYFVLYPEKIKKFLEREGVIAWGAVPTSAYNDEVTIDVITKKLNDALDALSAKGIDRDYILKQSLFTPACGIGTLDVDIAEKVTALTKELSDKMK